MKTLLLFRHGIAEEPAAGVSDAARELTEEGVEKTRQAAAGLAKFITKPDAILTSPRRRAVQTAEIVGKALGIKPEVLDVLGEASPQQILRALQRRSEGTIVIVGHEPTFSEIIQLACRGGSPTFEGGFVELKKAGCACLEIGQQRRAQMPAAMLTWLATPGMLRRMGR